MVFWGGDSISHSLLSTSKLSTALSILGPQEGLVSGVRTLLGRKDWKEFGVDWRYAWGSDKGCLVPCGETKEMPLEQKRTSSNK